MEKRKEEKKKGGDRRGGVGYHVDVLLSCFFFVLLSSLFLFLYIRDGLTDEKGRLVGSVCSSDQPLSFVVAVVVVVFFLFTF